MFDTADRIFTNLAFKNGPLEKSRGLKSGLPEGHKSMLRDAEILASIQFCGIFERCDEV